jgi:hypothetical protein
MDLREIGCGSVEWIMLSQDRGRWRALVNTVMNLRDLVSRSLLCSHKASGTLGPPSEQLKAAQMRFSYP